MVANSLFRSLLAGCFGATNVLLVGDINQLPPVESGAPLRDLRKVLPYGQFTEIHRNAGTVVTACAALRDGLPIPIDSHIDLTEGKPPKNMVLHGATRDEMQSVVVNLVRRVAAEKKYDPIWDVQVCVATNKMRKELNKKLQDLLNPTGAGHQQSPFRVGDKVVCTDRSVLPLARYEGGEYRKAEAGVQVAICNGEFGRVLDVQPTRTVIAFGKNMVMVNRKATTGKSQPSKDDDENESSTKEKTDTGCSVDLAYAATTHKMQGSQEKYIIVVLEENQAGDHGICDRGWLTTAWSRMEVECHNVGRRDTIKKMASRNFIDRRQTFLAETIERLMKSARVVIPEPEAAGAVPVSPMASGEGDPTVDIDAPDDQSEEPTDIELDASDDGTEIEDVRPEHQAPTAPYLPLAPTARPASSLTAAESRRRPSFSTAAVVAPPSRRTKYTVQQANDLIEELESLADEMPSAASEFVESVMERVSSIAETIEEKNWVTEKQYEALENMLGGLQRWMR